MAQKADMDLAAAELDRRSRYLRSLIQQQKASNSNNPKAESLKAEKGEEKERRAPREEFLVVVKQQQEEKPPRKKGDVGRGGVVDPGEKNQGTLLRVRAADMPPELQKRAFRCAQQVLAHMPKLDSKRLALTLKKEFDSSYGPAWHCIVGKSFGSYVTHSLGGFLYFSIDKVYVLLFRTAVEPLEQ